MYSWMATYINCITGSADELDDTPTGGYDEEKPTSGYDDAPTQEESPTSTYQDAPPPPTVEPTTDDSNTEVRKKIRYVI